MQIRVLEVAGENAMTLDDGEAIYRLIHDPLAKGETVELDFAGVELFASPFFNAGIGHLLADLRPDTLNASLRFVHISPLGDRILRQVIENAKEYYAATPERQQRMDEIVRRTAEGM